MRTIVFQLQHQVIGTPNIVKKVFNKLRKVLELISENDIELHVKEVEKRGTRIEIENSGNNLISFDYFKSEIIAELRRVRYKDLKDTVYRMELTYYEIVDFWM